VPSAVLSMNTLLAVEMLITMQQTSARRRARGLQGRRSSTIVFVGGSGRGKAELKNREKSPHKDGVQLQSVCNAPQLVLDGGEFVSGKVSAVFINVSLRAARI
jgi:hypothetical protein